MFCIHDTFFGKTTNTTARSWNGTARRRHGANVFFAFSGLVSVILVLLQIENKKE